MDIPLFAEDYYATRFVLCDQCAMTISADTAVRSGDFVFCSEACKALHIESQKNHPFSAVRPARDQLGEN